MKAPVSTACQVAGGLGGSPQWSHLIPQQSSHPRAPDRDTGPVRSGCVQGHTVVSLWDSDLLHSPLCPLSQTMGVVAVNTNGCYQHGPCSVALGGLHCPTASGSPTPKGVLGVSLSSKEFPPTKLWAYKDRPVAGWAGSVEMAWAGGRVPSRAADGSRAHSDVGVTGSARLTDPCPSEKQAARQLRLPHWQWVRAAARLAPREDGGRGESRMGAGGEEFMKSFLKQLSPELGFVG